MSDCKIIGFLSENSERGVSIAILMDPDRSIVKLVAMRNGEQIEGTIGVELTSKRFDRLIDDYPDLKKRKYHVYGMCKVDYNVLYSDSSDETTNEISSNSNDHLRIENKIVDALATTLAFLFIIGLVCISVYLIGKFALAVLVYIFDHLKFD